MCAISELEAFYPVCGRFCCAKPLRLRSRVVGHFLVVISVFRESLSIRRRHIIAMRIVRLILEIEINIVA
jgi:hypothetical protein